jgi:hypothetical protein
VFPRYAPSFGSFEFSYPLTDGIRAFMPPQGLLVIAAAMPPNWQVRFIDENIAPAGADDFAWAEVVFVSGMHVQRRQIEDIRRRAQAFDRTAVLGGSSVSACPEHYPEFDYLHVGELGDATEELISRLARDPARPPLQIVLTTRARRELTDFPLPAYSWRSSIATSSAASSSPAAALPVRVLRHSALYGRNRASRRRRRSRRELDKMMAAACSAQSICR